MQRFGMTYSTTSPPSVLAQAKTGFCTHYLVFAIFYSPRFSALNDVHIDAIPTVLQCRTRTLDNVQTLPRKTQKKTKLSLLSRGQNSYQ